MYKVAAVLLALALTLTGWQTLNAQEPGVAQQIFEAYASGDSAVVSRALLTREQFGVVRSDILEAAGRWQEMAQLRWWQEEHPGNDTLANSEWHRNWGPTAANFLLETALVSYQRNFPEPSRLLTAARNLAMARPDAPGARPAADAYEIMFHHTALAALVGLNAFDAARAYLAALDERVAPEASPNGPARLVDPRPLLIRGVMLEIATRGTAMTADFDEESAAAVARNRRALTDAISTFKVAARYPGTRTEASVRAAFSYVRLGEPQQAIDMLDQSGGDLSDSKVVYWHWLVRGRALEALPGHDAAALDAYQHAAALFPLAQTPVIASAAVALRLGRQDDAFRWAAEGRSKPERPFDPWWQYWSGDLRLLPEWLAALRTAQP